MATRQYDIERSDEAWEVAASVGGAISDEIRIIVDESLTRDEIMAMLDNFRTYLFQNDFPTL